MTATVRYEDEEEDEQTRRRRKWAKGRLIERKATNTISLPGIAYPFPADALPEGNLIESRSDAAAVLVVEVAGKERGSIVPGPAFAHGWSEIASGVRIKEPVEAKWKVCLL